MMLSLSAAGWHNRKDKASGKAPVDSGDTAWWFSCQIRSSACTIDWMTNNAESHEYEALARTSA
jgi:hypothetical protein